jgi:SAM-dependent methyltransferase
MKEATYAQSGLADYGWLHDPESRARRARRIVTTLRACGVEDLDDATALDIGCSAGLVTLALAASFRRVVGIDSDGGAIAVAHGKSLAHDGVSFVVGNGARLPFSNDCFRVVVCNHVYEHVDDAPALMTEILRVLAPGGVCYFAAGHTLQLIEPHYRLPFLSWLPRWLANRYLRVTGRGTEYRERFLAPWRLPNLLSGFARRELVSTQMLREPERFELTDGLLRYRWVRNVARAVPNLVGPLAPTYVWVLWKAGEI